MAREEMKPRERKERFEGLGLGVGCHQGLGVSSGQAVHCFPGCMRRCHHCRTLSRFGHRNIRFESGEKRKETEEAQQLGRFVWEPMEGGAPRTNWDSYWLMECLPATLSVCVEFFPLAVLGRGSSCNELLLGYQFFH
jgi:hypothetical protein